MPARVARTGNNLAAGAFIPEVWAKKLNVKYYAQTCLADITNNDYEGEIKGQGATVQIRNRPTVAISDYTVNQDIQYQDIDDEKIELLIDKAKSFAFRVDDVDAAQSDIRILNELTQDASYQMKIAIDTNVLGTIYGDATNSLSTLALDKTNVIDWIIDAEVKMEENNLPTDNRWLVIPPKVAGLIQKSDLKNASITGDSKSIVRSGMNNGRLGEVGGLTLYISNNLAVTSGSTYQCVAGHKSAVTFASQIVKVENLRLQTKFGDAVRGLNVYGYKTVLPSGLVSMPVTVSA
jgi:hypothetical protein